MERDGQNMIVYKRNGVLFGELWFDEEPDGTVSDILHFRQRTSHVKGASCSDFYTILVDLTANEVDLLAGISKDTRYEIRRAGNRDDLLCDFWRENSHSVTDEFCDFYDKFAQQKNLAKTNRGRMTLLAKSGSLALSRVRNSDDRDLVWHAYFCSSDRVRLLYSASLFRNQDKARRSLTGRANRYLHWQDMLRFKSEGAIIYDLGGWYEGNDDEEKLRINKFKEEFGGDIVKTYNCEHGVTLKGKIALGLLGALRWIKAR